MIHVYVIVAVIAYLLGSIPFGLILTRLFLGTDVRKIGSGNIGATNVMRTGSKKLGIATLILDAAKGYAAVTVAKVIAIHLGASESVTYRLLGIAAVVAMIGHVFPIWLKFKGGKGVATGVGVFLAVAPKAVLIVLGIFAIIFAISRYVSLASIIATAVFPLFAYLLMTKQHQAMMPFIIAAAILIIAKHHQNIRRLLSGTESRLELKSSK
jgi:glycerol-3-phosphate acyltransferase PlsY